MKRDNTIHVYDTQAHPEILRKQMAIHEAGHAAAIFLGNRQKQLPPVFFQIVIKKQFGSEQRTPQTVKHADCPMTYFAKVEGGRLIHTLPSSLTQATQRLSDTEKQAYETAFEADIVNLLAGPLAEANYVASSDGELFNPRLVNLGALQFYGGTTDVEMAKEYLDCLAIDQQEKERKIAELFMEAFQFISKPSNWRAVNALADFILNAGKTVIDCEEIALVLDPYST